MTFLCSQSDIETIAACRATGCRVVVVPDMGRGDYAYKINTAIEMTDFQYVFTGADDLEFHAGWFEAACRKMGPGTGVVGTNDLGSPRVMAGDHATHMLVRTMYVRQFGTIDNESGFFHEGYWHEYVDDEAVATAKKRGAWAHAGDSVVEHLHPSHGKAQLDRMYRQQGERLMYGRRIFRNREYLWKT